VNRSIWIGYEPREADAYLVCVSSIRAHCPDPPPIRPLILEQLRLAGLYARPSHQRNGRMFDEISGAPCSTEFAISRFLTPILAKTGWALFMDCDMLARADIRDLFEQADPRKAVLCVQHNHVPAKVFKMDDQIQLRYRRKNWSSVMLFNCDHPANKKLTLGLVNSLPGRDLHAFCWLEDSEIGSLRADWNHLEGETAALLDPKIVHFTNGIPRMPGYEVSPFAEEWRSRLWSELGHGA
jgi:hypothetical protein